jgi:hypothetical protein
MTRPTGQTTQQQTAQPKNVATETSMSEPTPIREGLSNEQVCMTLIYVRYLVYA